MKKITLVLAVFLMAFTTTSNAQNYALKTTGTAVDGFSSNEIGALLSNETAFTIEFLYEIQTFKANTWIFKLGNWNATTKNNIGLFSAGVDNGGVFVRIGNASNNAQQPFFNTDVKVSEGWNHVALTYNAGIVKLYINGVEKTGGAITGSYPATIGNLTAEQFQIGWTTEANIDELRITKGTALSTIDIAKSATPANFDAYFDFNANERPVGVKPGNAQTANTGSDATVKGYINNLGTTNEFTNNFTATGNWSDVSKWSLGRLPSASDNVEINAGVTTTFNVATATVNDINLTATSVLNIDATNALTLEGDLTQNGTFNIASNATNNGSLIVKGTSTGNVNYQRYLTASAVITEAWHLVSSPVESQNIIDFSGVVSTNGNNYAIAPYSNNTTSLLRWNYYTTNAGSNDIAAAGNFLTAKGYTIKKDAVGTLDFTGTLNTTDKSIAITDGGDEPAGNRWNLIGNPYTAAIHANNNADATNNFLKVNIDAGNLDPARAGLYLWNGGTNYVEKSVDDAAFYIAPGQGFFVFAPVTGGTSASFTEAMQTHQTGNVFLKGGTNYPEAILKITDGTNNSVTKVRYIANKTNGLDVGSDVGTFTGITSNLKVFTHLVNNNEGVDFAIQALPETSLETMIVPVGVIAEANAAITFSVESKNLLNGINVYLEDRLLNTFTRLNEANANYKVTLSSDAKGTGRFYLHTASKALSTDSQILNSVSIYKTNNNTLRIAGLQEGNTAVKIFNVLGKQVLNTSFSANGVKEITLPNVAKGVYIIQLQTESGKLSKKIILE